MNCNAWNHPPGCACGWGGKYHGQGSWTSGPRSHWQIPSSYTIPNARCPRCRAQVFFYASPRGGKVYFDELGPPWPKHPCTDQSPSGASAVGKAGRCVEASWKPLICLSLSVDKRCRSVTRLRIQMGRDEEAEFFAVVQPNAIVEGAPLLCRVSGSPGNLDVSTPVVAGSSVAELRFQAFASIDALPRELAQAVKGLHVVKGIKPVSTSAASAQVQPPATFIAGNASPSFDPKKSANQKSTKGQGQTAPRRKQAPDHSRDVTKAGHTPHSESKNLPPDPQSPLDPIDPGSAYALSQLKYRSDLPKQDGKLLRLQHKLRLKALKKL